MSVLYALSLILITTYLHPLLAMHRTPTITESPLTKEQNEFISTVALYREVPHRISFEKIIEYKNLTEKLFNKDTYPHHYHDLTNSLTKTEIDKSLLIISTPPQKNLFNKEDCIAEINWLASKVTKLQETHASLLPYCTQQIIVCRPECIQQLQSDKEFISRTYDSLLILRNINPNFTPTIPANPIAVQKSDQLKNFLLKNFIAVPDITLMQRSEKNIVDTLNECHAAINTLHPYETEEKKDLIDTLKIVCDKYKRIREHMFFMEKLYTQCLLTIQMAAPTTSIYASSFSTLVLAKNDNTLYLYANLYRQFTKIQQENTAPLAFLTKG